MYRTHTCGELQITDVGRMTTLSGWVQRIRDFGGMLFIDLRDRYGITQIVFNPGHNAVLTESAKELGREYVITISGNVKERSNKNSNLLTGDIEILADELQVLNVSKVPPFTIEDETDGGEDLRMKYRYLDLRRKPNQSNLIMRHRVAKAVREYLDDRNFVDIETPHLIKSTPEGARDFVVPSRLNEGQFYALPQSPQTFKQLLMIAGYDRYYQIVRCFRDEDLRADRQPEFTQIDCEMAFVEREDVLQMFEGMVRHVFMKVRNIELPGFIRMSYDDAIFWYGNDKPDLRFDMKFIYLKTTKPEKEIEEKEAIGDGDIKLQNFKPFHEADIIAGILVPQCAHFSRKQLDELTDFVKRPQLGAGGLIYIRYEAGGNLKSSIDKFYSADSLKVIAEKFKAQPGDLILILAGEENKTRRALSELRLEMGTRLGLRKKDEYKPLWVVDFPLLEWDENERRWNAMHHPFTSWRKEDDELLRSAPGRVKANAYDVVINGVEIGGGSIRIHNRSDQERMFKTLGLSRNEAQEKFGFILSAFEYGAPPHGGIAFGFDRFCSMTIANQEGIRDFIAFPKNNMGRDMMLDAPSDIDASQKKELGLM